MGKAFRCARYVESPFWPSFTIHQIILKFLPLIVLFFRTLLFSLFVALTEKRYLVLAWPWHELKTVLNGSSLFPISIVQHKDKQYSMWSLVRGSPRCPWSASFPKMIKYFVKKKNTLNNERYRDLLISILSYDEVSAFLLRVKTRN